MPEENNNDTEQTRTRRSQTKKELEALGELIQILKPLSPEQRDRLLKAAAFMLEQ